MVNVYPNPANDAIYFSMENTVEGEVLIYNLAGKQLKRKTIEDSVTEISISDLNNGMYFYRVIRRNGSVLSGGKCIISR